MRVPRRRFSFALCLALTGCGDSDVHEIQQWMAEVQSQARVAVPPLSAPTIFIPFVYTAKDQIDPFSPNKLLIELAKVTKSGNAFKPDTARRKELLESFPLDTIKMVGMIQQAGVIHALLQIDRAVYQIEVGQHVGQNFGRVASVSEAAVNILEIVQDASGDWVERATRLELQENKETKK